MKTYIQYSLLSFVVDVTAKVLEPWFIDTIIVFNLMLKPEMFISSFPSPILSWNVDIEVKLAASLTIKILFLCPEFSLSGCTRLQAAYKSSFKRIGRLVEKKACNTWLQLISKKSNITIYNRISWLKITWNPLEVPHSIKSDFHSSFFIIKQVAVLYTANTMKVWKHYPWRNAKRLFSFVFVIVFGT